MHFFTRLMGMLKRAHREAFSSYPLRIVGKSTDSLTKMATFSLKAKRMPTAIKLTTKEIIDNDKYFSGLSAQQRLQIERQYVFELNRPLAYIESYPLDAPSSERGIFKILLLDQGKIICGSAEYFIKHDRKTLSLLSKDDFARIYLLYQRERFFELTESPAKVSNNIHVLKTHE